VEVIEQFQLRGLRYANESGKFPVPIASEPFSDIPRGRSGCFANLRMKLKVLLTQEPVAWRYHRSTERVRKLPRAKFLK
jgi:hypothetical protein